MLRAIAVSLAIHTAVLVLAPRSKVAPTADYPALNAILLLPPQAAEPSSEPISVQAPVPPLAHRTAPMQHSKALAEATPAPSPVFFASKTELLPAVLPLVEPAVESDAPLTRVTPAPKVNAAEVVPTIDPAALERYGRILSDLFARRQQYPRLAALRGWEGEVRLKLRIARKGGLIAIEIVHSSGYEVLDQNAVDLVKNALPLPPVPEIIQASEIQISVPVLYRLEKPA